MTTRLQDLAAAVHTELADTSVVNRNNRQALHENDQKRRIVWIEPAGTFEPPKQSGGRHVVDGSDQFRVVSCKTRTAYVEAHIFGESVEAAELMLENLASALSSVVPQVELPRYDWVTQQEGREGHMVACSKIVLQIRVRWPVPSEIRPLTIITSVDEQCGTLQPDGSLPPIAEPQS